MFFMGVVVESRESVLLVGEGCGGRRGQYKESEN